MGGRPATKEELVKIQIRAEKEVKGDFDAAIKIAKAKYKETPVPGGWPRYLKLDYSVRMVMCSHIRQLEVDPCRYCAYDNSMFCIYCEYEPMRTK
jgi:hypothetical protein